MAQKDYIIDDRHLDKGLDVVMEVNKHGTSRVNGKTTFEILRDYKKTYGEKDYVQFLLKEKMTNPRGIKIQDDKLAEKVEKAGLQL